MNDSKMKTSIAVSLGSMPLKAGVTVGAALIALNLVEHPIPVFRKDQIKLNNWK